MSTLPALNSRQLVRRCTQLLLIVALVALAIGALPGLDGVRRHLEDADAAWLTAAVAAELASAVGYVVILRAVFCACMRWRLGFELGLSELAAASLFPAGGAGGLALGAWALRRGGMKGAQIARRTIAFFLLTSAANFAAVVVAGAGVAVGLVPGDASTVLTVVPAVVAAAAIMAVLALPRLLNRSWRRTLVARLGAEIDAGVGEVRRLLSGRRSAVIAGSVAYMTFDLATLAACFEATGSIPPLGVFVLAYAIGQLGALVPLPGGVGATEGGLIAAFVLYGGSLEPVTAAVVIYRLIQLGVPALLGAPAFVLLQRELRTADVFGATGEPAADRMRARTHGLLPGGTGS